MIGVVVESGVEWIGTLPAHWTVRKLRYSVKIPNGQVDPKLDRFRDLPLIAPNHIESGTGRLLEFSSADEQGAESGKYQFHKGDVLYSKIRPELAKACLAPIDGLCSADMYPLNSKKDVDPGFLAYLLISSPFTQYVVLASSRVAMPKVNRDELGDCQVPVPPIEEQQVIADFLDRKTAEIDALISKKRRMIDLLQEKRQALISEAVIKGLDPDVPMKDSEFPWLGLVPAHWTVERLRWRLRSIGQGWSPQCESRRAEPGEWGVLKVGCMNSGVYDESENKALPPELDPLPDLEVRIGDVLMSRSNTVDLVGAVGIVHQTQGRILLCDKLYRLDFDRSILLPSYSVHLLRSRAARLQIERDATGASSSMKNISNEVVANMVFAFPRIEEQRQIDEFINRESSRMGALERTISAQIDRLLEYRRTLISEAVTGKIQLPPEVAL